MFYTDGSMLAYLQQTNRSKLAYNMLKKTRPVIYVCLDEHNVQQNSIVQSQPQKKPDSSRSDEITNTTQIFRRIVVEPVPRIFPRKQISKHMANVLRV